MHVSSAGNTRGLIEGRPPDAQALERVKSSAGNTRGLIEGREMLVKSSKSTGSSAGNTRGLIEGQPLIVRDSLHPVGLPRGIPAASLKGIGPGLVGGRLAVFRGEYPRPH